IRISPHNQVTERGNLVSPSSSLDPHLLGVSGVVDSQVVDEAVSQLAVFFYPVGVIRPAKAPAVIELIAPKHVLRHIYPGARVLRNRRQPLLELRKTGMGFGETHRKNNRSRV